MKEIPIPYVRINQGAMVLFIVIAAIFQQPWIIAGVWLIEAVGLLFGVKANLFVLLGRGFVKSWVQRSGTDAAELQRFNNTIAVSLLTLSLIAFYAFSWTVAGFILAGMVALAAFAAILGYCIGCTIYYQFKQFKSRRKMASNG